MSLKPIKACCVFGFCLCCLFQAQPSHALAFTPTETEWVTWPDYCRARYVVSGAGVKSLFAARVPESEISRQQARMGAAWYWLHHYCAGLAYLSRANADAAKTEYWLKEAEVNFLGYYQRVDQASPMFVDAAINMAQVHRKRGDTGTALRFLDEAMHAQPAATSPYALASIVYRENRDLKGAVAVLLRGNEAVGGNSAELHYFLGLIYIELKDLESATNHAKRAYELGYPLPGLASKLQQLGYPLDSR